MRYTYIPRGICPKKITVTLENGLLEQVEFSGGCEGNLQALSRLVKGMKPEELSQALGGLTCGKKKTSCGDQLVKAVQAAIDSEN